MFSLHFEKGNSNAISSTLFDLVFPSSETVLSSYPVLKPLDL